MGGRSAERAVSLQSGAAVVRALESRGWNVTAIDVGDTPDKQIREADITVAFVTLHGRYGEDGCIQGLLESISVPYSGSGILASALAMDKVTSKQLFDAAALPTPRWSCPVDISAVSEIGVPAVLKPRSEGSSVGVRIFHDAAQLREAVQQLSEQQREALVLEQYIPGHELSVAVFGQGQGATVLGTVEIQAATGDYDYAAKYQRTDTQYVIPAPLPAPVAGRMSAFALRAHQVLRCSGATRIDFRWDGDPEHDPQLLEVNTLPGMTDHSLLPKIAAVGGISYEDLVERILSDAGLKA